MSTRRPPASHAFRAISPPSTGMTAPVRNDAAGNVTPLVSIEGTEIISDVRRGKRVQILCEGPSKTNPATLSGRSPGNKIVIFEGGERHIGEVFDVQIERASGFSLYGNPAVL